MNHIYLDVLPRSFNIQTTDCTMVQEDHLWYTFLQLNPLSSKSHTDTVEGCFILFSVTILCWYIADDKCERCYWTRKFTTIGEWKGKLHDRHSRLNYKYSQSHHNAKSNRNSGGNCSTRGGPVIEQGQRHISGFFENDEPNTSPSPSHGSCFLGYRTRLTKNYKHITRLQTI